MLIISGDILWFVPLPLLGAFVLPLVILIVNLQPTHVMSATGESGLGHKVEETEQYAQEKAGQTQEAAKVALIMQISYAI